MTVLEVLNDNFSITLKHNLLPVLQSDLNRLKNYEGLRSSWSINPLLKNIDTTNFPKRSTSHNSNHREAIFDCSIEVKLDHPQRWLNPLRRQPSWRVCGNNRNFPNLAKLVKQSPNITLQNKHLPLIDEM